MELFHVLTFHIIDTLIQESLHGTFSCPFIPYYTYSHSRSVIMSNGGKE